MSNVIPIYTTKGDPEAFLQYPYLFNRAGEWVGFVTTNRDVYSVRGEYVGTLTNDPRIVRKRSTATLQGRLEPPAAPKKILLPANVPLAPLMQELSHALIDVLIEMPERLHTLDAGESREDMD